MRQKKQLLKNKIRGQRRRRVRAKISGTASVPRLSVYRSLLHIYAQLIDDSLGKTIASVSDKEIKDGQTKIKKAHSLGKLLAQKASEKGISRAVFDKGRFLYHGQVKAVADGAREGGLII